MYAVLTASGLDGTNVNLRASALSVSVPAALGVNCTVPSTVMALTGSLSETITRVLTGTAEAPSTGEMLLTAGPVTSAAGPVVNVRLVIRLRSPRDPAGSTC